MSADITTSWRGPFCMVPIPTETWVAEVPEALQPGVYLWTVKVGDEYKIHYIGMSANSITARTLEHVSKCFGAYPVYKAKDLRRGKQGRHLFWKTGRIPEADRERALMEIVGYINEIQLFIAPIDVTGFDNSGKWELERIESALIDQVRESEKNRDAFLTNRRRSTVVPPSDRDICVSISLPSGDKTIAGLPSRFNA